MFTPIFAAVLGSAALWFFDAPAWASVLLIVQTTCSWFAWWESEMRNDALVGTIRADDARSEVALRLQLNEVGEHASFAAKWSQEAWDAVKDLDVNRYSQNSNIGSDDE